MKFFIFIAAFSAACSLETTTTPSKVPSPVINKTVISDGEVQSLKQPNGGKACVLTPADYSGPTCHYTCPNGSTYDIPSVDNFCIVTAPYPKK
jgi:hypothetical protein